MRFCGLRFQGTSVKYRWDVVYMDVSENSGTPKSSILVGFSVINHPFWGTPIFGNTHMYYNYHYVYKDRCTHMHICIHPDGEVRFSPAKKSAFVDPKKYFNLSSLVKTYFFLYSPGWSILSSHGQQCRRLI